MDEVRAARAVRRVGGGVRRQVAHADGRRRARQEVSRRRRVYADQTAAHGAGRAEGGHRRAVVVQACHTHAQNTLTDTLISATCTCTYCHESNSPNVARPLNDERYYYLQL